MKELMKEKNQIILQTFIFEDILKSSKLKSGKKPEKKDKNEKKRKKRQK